MAGPAVVAESNGILESESGAEAAFARPHELQPSVSLDATGHHYLRQEDNHVNAP